MKKREKPRMMANELPVCLARQTLGAKFGQNLVSAAVEMGTLWAEGSGSPLASSCWVPTPNRSGWVELFYVPLLNTYYVFCS